MAPCAPRAAAASVDCTSGFGDRTHASRDCDCDCARIAGARTLGSVVRRAGVVWSRRTVHFGAVSPRS